MEGDEAVNKRGLTTLVGLGAGFALGLIIAWIYWMQREEAAETLPPTMSEGERLPLEPGLADKVKDPPARPEPDDLTRVEGIGPKISSVLRQAGIVTFGQLAETQASTLRQILRAQGLQFADPTTWPEQAALAAVGDWEGLDALQQQLSGGRRT
ncbi:MAG: DUF4332 domain-containing protein [Anaerolineae bacterium]|jgi:predicted flap endonuclease-1-like 5' DNA nuclease